MTKYIALFIAAFFIASFAATNMAAPAKAQSSRLYFAGYMGLNVFNSNDYKETDTPSDGEIDFSDGASFAGALGLRLSKKIDLEAELSYRQTDMDSIGINGAGHFDLGGDLDSWALMLNAYYNIDLEWEKLFPYITAGVGIIRHDGTIRDSSGFATDASDTDIGMGWQLGSGLKYRLSDMMALTGGYRYMGASDLDLGAYNIDYSSHEFRLGLEYDIPVKAIQ